MKETFSFADTIPTILYGKRKAIWEVTFGSPTLFKPEQLDLGHTRLYVMRDHDGAGKVWDAAFDAGQFSAATLVHVDAHDDLAFHSPLPQTREEVLRQEYEVGSFILPRVNVGCIQNIYWVAPFSLDRTTQERRAPSSGRVIPYPESLGSDELSTKPTVIVSKEIPQVTAELIDIDLDFFTYDLESYYPNYLLKIQAKKFFETILKRVLAPKIITIAISPGYITGGRERPLLEAALEVFQSKNIY